MSAIRPTTFDSFFGQVDIVNYLRTAVKSVAARNAVLGHMLLLGPAGVGKTTLAASVLPTEINCSAQSINCAAIEKSEDLTRKLVLMGEGSILFLDEIHALPGEAREHLLTVMEDSSLTVTVPEREPMVVQLPTFTVIAATTRAGNLDAPLRTRFKHVLRLSHYSDSEMAAVIGWIVGKRDGITIQDDAVQLLVPAAHGIARTAVNLIDACIDTLYGENLGLNISFHVAGRTLNRLGYVGGFNSEELRYLKAFASATGTLKLGLSTLAAILDEPQSTLEEVYEPFLLREGYIEKTSGGRKLTPKGVGTLAQLNL